MGSEKRDKTLLCNLLERKEELEIDHILPNSELGRRKEVYYVGTIIEICSSVTV